MADSWDGSNDFGINSTGSDEYWFGGMDLTVMKSVSQFEGEEDFRALDTYCYARSENEADTKTMYLPTSLYVGTEISCLLDQQTNDESSEYCSCSEIQDDMSAFNFLLQTQGLMRPSIEYISKGPSHNPRFVGTSSFRGINFITRECKTKKEVEKCVVHIILHHMPTQDVQSNVYRFVEMIFDETLVERSDIVKWYVQPSVTVLQVERGGSSMVFLYPDGNISRGRYECMHSYNKFYRAYETSSVRVRDFGQMANRIGVSVVSGKISSPETDFIQSVIDSDPPIIRMLKMVRVMCGNDEFKKTFIEVTLSPVRSLDRRTLGDAFVNGVSVKSLMSNPKLSHLVEREHFESGAQLKSVLRKFDEIADVDEICDQKGITDSSPVLRGLAGVGAQYRQSVTGKAPSVFNFSHIDEVWVAPVKPLDVTKLDDHARESKMRTFFVPKEKSINYSNIMKTRSQVSAERDALPQDVKSSVYHSSGSGISSPVRNGTYRIVSQGREFLFQNGGTDGSGDPSSVFRATFVSRTSKIFKDPLTSVVSSIILDCLFNAEGPVTSQEVVKYVNSKKSHHYSCGAQINKSVVHRVLQEGSGVVWTYVVREKDKLWVLKVEDAVHIVVNKA